MGVGVGVTLWVGVGVGVCECMGVWVCVSVQVWVCVGGYVCSVCACVYSSRTPIGQPSEFKAVHDTGDNISVLVD